MNRTHSHLAPLRRRLLARTILLPALVWAWVFTAMPAFSMDIGGTQLNWWACPGDRRATPGVPFDCIPEGGTVYTLVGTFTLDSDVPNAVAMNADVNIAFPGASSVPSFWDIDLGGCNPFSFGLIKGMPPGCVEHVNAFCRGDSNQCDLVYSVFAVPGQNILKLSITMGRDFLHTVDLVGGQRYFGFAINIPMLGAASCFGCSQPCAIGFSKGTIYSVDDQGQLLPAVTVSGSYPGTVACATANDGYSECITVPVRRVSWGKLKSLYR